MGDYSTRVLPYRPHSGTNGLKDKVETDFLKKSETVQHNPVQLATLDVLTVDYSQEFIRFSSEQCFMPL